MRALLNFGHTFAHAIEAGLGYGTWLHGEAVGCGMVMAADLSLRLGLIGADMRRGSPASSTAAGLPLAAPSLGVPRYLELMRMDKKAVGGEPAFRRPGRARPSCRAPCRRSDRRRDDRILRGRGRPEGGGKDAGGTGRARRA